MNNGDITIGAVLDVINIILLRSTGYRKISCIVFELTSCITYISNVVSSSILTLCPVDHNKHICTIIKINNNMTNVLKC